MILENKDKTAAVLYADLDKSVLGLPSRIGNSLAGVSVLQRTVNRLEESKQLDEIIICCPVDQVAAVRKIAGNPEAIFKGVKQLDLNDTLVRKRKWALSSWRGGLGDATNFDEQLFTREMVGLLNEQDIQVVISVPAEAVFVDPQLLDELVEHHIAHADEMRFTFAHTSPGISCCLFRIDLLADLVQAGASIGSLLAYQPDSPRSDYINHNCTFVTDPQLGSLGFRFLADTQRSFQVFHNILHNRNESGLHRSAREMATWVGESGFDSEELPREIEVEINTERSLRINGYPHEAMQGRRPAMTMDTFEKIVTDCAAFDDICLTIGGFGEPLLHSDLAEMVALAKSKGILGINIETDGCHLSGDVAKAIVRSQVDTISIYLDADSPQLYQAIKGIDLFEDIVENIETFIQQSNAVRGPTVIPHMIKSRRTLPEMESFYDRWLRKCGHAVVTGYNDFCGQIEDKAVMDMSSPNRSSCRRLFRTLTILSDGSAVLCGQDFSGTQVVGNVRQSSISEIWRSDAMESIRNSHLQGDYGCNALCANCKEWHR